MTAPDDRELGRRSGTGAKPVPPELLSDLEQTRAEIAETVEELQRRLSAGYLANAAGRRMRELAGSTTDAAAISVGASIGRVRQWLWQIGHRSRREASAHPKQAVVVALASSVALSLLVARGRRRRATRRRSASHEPRPSSGPDSDWDEVDAALRGEYSPLEPRNHTMYRETQNASTRTTPGGHAARRALWLTAGSIALIWMWSQRGHAHASEIDGDSEWRTRLADLVENHPFVAIGAAGAVGAAAAFTLPVSAAEDRWMGAARDTVVDQAHSRSWEALRAIVHAAAPAVSRVVPW